jgi:ketosteroid isomerase-like protein
MKSFVTTIIGVSVLLLGSMAHAGDAGVERAIAAFGAAFNKGDIPAAKALMTPTVTITDEVAPYLWSGSGSLDAWLGDLATSEAAEGKTGAVVAIGAPSREVVSGDHAYVIAPSTYTFKQKGTLMRETAQMTFALAKGPGGWKVAAFTWTGPDAEPLR